MGIASKIFSAGSNRPIKRYTKIVNRITALEDEYKAMTDEEIVQRNNELRDKAREGEDESYVKENALALLREHIRRMDGRRAYDVQLMAGLALWDNCIIEAATGSGKTLVSHFPAYLAALYGKQAHIITVNEYLTQRDADEAHELLAPLGITVGRIYNQQQRGEKQKAYSADIVYGTPSEFGFDYLRDNMVSNYDEKVQTSHDYVIIDEVDSVLIDEAKTPLIISGEGSSSSATYKKFSTAVRNLVEDEDYTMEEDKKQIATTEHGLEKIEKRLGFKVFDDSTGELANHLMQAMKAEYLFYKDKDYLVTGGEVKIVDQNTGRVMEGRRWSEGLHQAIEAKENVDIQEENQTLATVTLQNYFRLYDRLSGMTGTALTEATEFRETYGVETLGIPTNELVIRQDENDVIFVTADAKYNAVANEIEEAHKNGQPVLAGTISVENSERLSRILTKRNIPHTVLNAKHHAKEAEIVAQAGRVGAVTIATNMAGRGTDIILGGNVKGMAKTLANEMASERCGRMTKAERDEAGPTCVLPTDDEKERAKKQAQSVYDVEHPKVMEAGGLYVIGTERHEARRIDNQLRGRSGRQGDPGRSRFFISLDDDLMRLFGDNIDRLKSVMAKANMDEDEPINSKMVSKAIESAQHKIEQIHYEQRKNTLDFDDVINRQRKLIYAERDSVLMGEDIGSRANDIIYDEVTEAFDEFAPSGKSDKWDVDGLSTWYSDLTGQDGTGIVTGFEKPVTRKEQEEKVRAKLKELYDSKVSAVNNAVPEAKREFAWKSYQRQVMLGVIDKHWRSHLSAMEYLRTGIGLRGVGQRDPRIEYKRESKRAFDILVDNMYSEYLKTLLRLRIVYAGPSVARTPQKTAYRYTQPADLDGDERLGTQDTAGAHMPLSNNNATGVLPAQTAVTAGIVGSGMGNASTYRKDPNDPFANVGRNDPCPCGSGKKFKNCHGRR